MRSMVVVQNGVTTRAGPWRSGIGVQTLIYCCRCQSWMLVLSPLFYGTLRGMPINVQLALAGCICVFIRLYIPFISHKFIICSNN